MPREIADSDAESEFEIDTQARDPQSHSSELPTEATCELITPTGLQGVDDYGQPGTIQVDFDQFLSQTQSLSRASLSQDAALRPGVDNMDQSEALQTLSSRKRRCDAIEDGSKRSKEAEGDIFASRKRPKTYATSERTRSEQLPGLYIEDTRSINFERTIDTKGSTTTTAIDTQDEIAEFATPRQRDRPRRVISLLPAFNETGHQLSTSRASMGGYQSINMDFRGSGMGMDINTNPFGALSQISLDGDSMSPETEKLANLFRRPANGIAETNNGLNPDHHDAEDVPEPNLELSATVDPTSIMIVSENRESATPITDANNHDVPVEKTQPTKRKRKAKSFKSSSKITADIQDIDQESQRATTESLSQASQNEIQAQDHSPGKQLTNELNLSDELIVGLPKENYQPRPSRSRSKMIENDENIHNVQVQVEDIHQKDSQPITEKKMSAPIKPAKGKKTKVKRAKTSAAALLQRSEQMLSDGDEDVVWMDKKPASVKLDLPPDISPIKQEIITEQAEAGVPNTADPLSAEKEEQAGIEHQDTEQASAEAQSAPQPRKRGRKPKKSNQTEVEAPSKATDEENIEEESSTDQTVGREVLKEKDLNVSIPVSPEKPRSTEAKAESNTTPSKLTESPEKGPTKHSPINPPDSSFKFKYRVGLSRRQHIPSLLRKVDKSKEPPKIVPRKEKKKKADIEVDPDADPNESNQSSGYQMRDAHGNLVEWDF